MQTVYASGGGGSQQREVADVVFTDTAFATDPAKSAILVNFTITPSTSLWNEVHCVGLVIKLYY